MEGRCIYNGINSQGALLSAGHMLRSLFLDPNTLGNRRTHCLDLEPGKFGQLLLLLMYEASSPPQVDQPSALKT